jgi:hypothetical protein
MADVTFRDFAGAVMSADTARATQTLETLLGLPTDQAQQATEHFRTRATSGDPSFLPKAMQLRTAVTSGSDDEIFAILVECFGLATNQRASVIAALRKRYPAT